MRHFISCLLILFAGVHLVLGADVPSSVSISRLQIKKKCPAALDVHFTNDEGIQLACVLSLPDKVIVGINTGASKLVSATDDKGINLAQDPLRHWINDVFCKISSSKHEIAVPIHFTTIPSPEAKSIQFKAEIAVTCHSLEKIETVKPFDLIKGTTMQCGEHTLVVAIGESQKPDLLMMKVTSAEGGYWLEIFEFIDAQGNAIETENAGSESRGGSVTQCVSLNSQTKTAGLRVTYYGKLEDIKQSVDMKISLGLP